MLLRLTACAALLASLVAGRNVVRQNTVSEPDVTVTETVINSAVSTDFTTTTIFKTVFSTIVVTKTEITTETVTEKDVATATSVIYTTVTQNAKRWLNNNAAAASPQAQATVPPPTLTADDSLSQITPAPAEDGDDDLAYADDPYRRPEAELKMLIKRGIIMKRATVTTTITIIDDGVTTVVRTQTNTVVSTTSSETTSLSTLTTTTFENAKTTVTETSTIFVKTTTVTTGPAETVSSLPPDANIGTDIPNAPDGSSSDRGGGSGGLSTGAKAGIGAAAGVVGAAVLAGLAFFFWRRHKAKPKVTDDGTGMGMSEVPVGGIGPPSGGITPRYTPSPMTSTIPATGMTSSGTSPTYTGDRYSQGPAELGGLAKRPDAELGGDELPRFPEADSRPIVDGRQHAPPGEPVYEMPGQAYRSF